MSERNRAGAQKRRAYHCLLELERLTLTVRRWTSEGYLEALIGTGDETVRAEPFEAIELPLADSFGIATG